MTRAMLLVRTDFLSRLLASQMAVCCGAAALLLLCGGCSTTEMKGTPFYTGEYAKRTGPAEQRLNVWPFLYYRDPALSVAWPIFERTDDHTAVRPLFSVYGLDRTNREYNLLWPLVQFDREAGENRIFPAFWGRDYQVLFPVYWHYGQPFGTNGGTDSVFPLWILKRQGTNDFDLYSPWPLAHWWSDKKGGESGSMVLPLYWRNHNNDGSRFLSLLWMSGGDTNGGHWSLVPLVCYQSTNSHGSALVTPLWAQGKSATRDWSALIPLCYWDREQRTLLSPLWARWKTEDRETYFSAGVLSWMNRRPERDDLWLAGGLAHASWGEKPGPHHFLPLYYRDAANEKLLTPLFGWRGEGKGYFYPLTPLAGVRSGEQGGHWLFPLYSHKVVPKTETTKDRLLVLGGRDRTAGNSHWWIFPAFSFHNNGPLDSLPTKKQSVFGKEFWCLPFCWYERQSGFWSEHSSAPGGVSPTNRVASVKSPELREYRFKNGVFPLWSYSTNSNPRSSRSATKGSIGVLLYDYKHELGPPPAKDPSAANDYTRARVLWRVWHYERRNGDVAVDVFPAITYDRKTDGYKKVSFLGRVFRYERPAKGGTQLDVLFIPLRR
jgi:hypothetical protein